jgi:hypothetical protein
MRILRSTMAVFVGFISVAVLSLGTDQVLHVLEIYPPWGKPMHDPSLNVLALSYRIVYTILGGYITASLAPHAPMRHVIVVGIVGFVAGSAGAITAITVADLGPDWYPIALALTAFPCVWLGGVLHRVTHCGEPILLMWRRRFRWRRNRRPRFCGPRSPVGPGVP